MAIKEVVFHCAAIIGALLSTFDSNHCFALTPAAHELGPFLPAPALTIYWINRPKDCKASIRASTTTGENFFVRVSESSSALWSELTTRTYFSLPPAVPPTVQSRTIALTFSDSSPLNSVTEIRVSTGGIGGAISLVTSCEVADEDYAVSFQNGDYSPWSTGMKGPLYGFVPYRAEGLFLKLKNKGTSLKVTGMSSNVSGVIVDDLNAGPVGDGTVSDSPTPTALIPKKVSWQGPGHSDVLWRFDFSSDRWKFVAGGFPLLLSRSPVAARALKASLAFDGAHMIAHPFQLRALKYLRGPMFYLAHSAAPLEERFTQMLDPNNSSPLTQFPNYFLFNYRYGPFTDLRRALSTQTMTRGSDWLGSLSGAQARDQTSPTFLGDAALAPASIYVATQSGSGNIQLVTAPLAGYSNRRIANQVAVTANQVTRVEPLMDASRWDRLGVSGPIGSGATAAPPMKFGMSEDDGTTLSSMAALAVLDGSKHSPPFENLFYGEKKLIYRAALAALNDFITLPESEIWHFLESDLNGIYAGGDPAFVSSRRVLTTYGTLGAFLRRLFCASSPTPEEKIQYACSQRSNPPLTQAELQLWKFTPDEIPLLKEVFTVLTEGAHRFAYRMFPNNLVTARNQSSHYLVAFQAMAAGSGDPFDEQLAAIYVQRWVDSQNPSGWFMEKGGPDASYIGMTNWHAASYYLDSCKAGACDQRIKSSIAKTYRYFNHTVAPEPLPSAAILGGFNFNHRVGAGFDAEQFAGARGIAIDIPEVATWTKYYLGASGKGPQRIPKILNPQDSRFIDAQSQRYHAFSFLKDAAPAPLPALSPSSFTRLAGAGNDLVAVKRPGYYTAVYVGRPAIHPYYVGTINDATMRLPWPNSGESSGFKIGDPHYWAAPFVGGGLSLFWTPTFGNGLLAGNWTPLVHHGLVATDGGNGIRSWEEYFSTSYEMSSDKDTLITRGRLEDRPCVNEGITPSRCSAMAGYTYSRTYQFRDSSIRITTAITAESTATVAPLSKVVENIPLAGGSPKVTGTVLPRFVGTTAGSMTPLQNGSTTTASAITYYTEDISRGFRVLFAPSTSKQVFDNGPMNLSLLQLNRIELSVPLPRPGTSSAVTYCLQAASADPRECGL